MGLAFLTPLFFLGLAALAVPILVHLSRRRQARTVSFPSLMFVGRVPYRSMRRRRIRNWLLLALRCAAYVLLALAFARPLLDLGASARAAGPGALHRVVLVDRSYSLGYGDAWSRALAAVEDATSGLGPDDVVSVVAFDENAEVLAEAVSDPAAAALALAGVEPGDRTTRFAPALKIARRLLLETVTPRREVVLVSDFQRVGRPDEPDLRLPSGTELATVDVGPTEPLNLAITETTLERGAGAERERLSAAVRLANTGSRPMVGADVELELNGRVVESRKIAVEAASTERLAFEPTVLEAGITTRGLVRVRHPEDALAADDLFHFVLSPSQGLPVLVIDGGDADDSLYLLRALALGDDPRFRVRRLRAAAVTANDLPEGGVVVVNDALVELPTAVGQALAERVAEGGGVLVALGPGWREERRPEWADGLGVPPVSETRRSSTAGDTVVTLDFDHPVLTPFGAPRSGDFSTVRVFQHQVLESAEGTAVLARFSDGSPALVESRVDEGRVLIWPSSFDTFWGDLPVQPVFLPLLHRSVQYLAGFAPSRNWYRVGEVADLTSEAVAWGQGEEPPEEWLVVAPSGEQRTLDWPGADAAFLVEIDERGFWELRPVGASAGELPITVAGNPDTVESDLVPLDLELFTAALAPAVGEPEGPSPGAAQEPAARERRQRLWWWLLALTVLILGLESWLARRASGSQEAVEPRRWRTRAPAGGSA